MFINFVTWPHSFFVKKFLPDILENIPWGGGEGLPYEEIGDACQKIKLKTPKKDQSGRWAQDHLK